MVVSTAGFSCISRHFARFTTRMSSIFSSMEAVFSSMRRSLSRVAHSSVSDWVMICGVVALQTVTSTEQSIGADQINIAIATLNNATQQTAADADLIAASAQQLAKDAKSLTEMVMRYKM